MTLGSLIREYRFKNKLTMDDFAKKANVSKAYISMLERNKNSSNGKPIIPSLPTLKKVAAAINVPIDELIILLDNKQLIIHGKQDIDLKDNLKLVTVSNNLKEAREKYDLSYADLANLTGIAKSTLQRYETGTTSKIPLDAIEKISKALGTTPQTLLGWQDDDMGDLESKEIFAANLNRLMQLNNKKQGDLSNDLRIKQTTLSDWVNAKKFPRIDKIEMLANYFGIKKSDLIESRDKSHEHVEKDINVIIEQLKKQLYQENLTFKEKPVPKEKIPYLIKSIQIAIEITLK